MVTILQDVKTLLGITSNDYDNIINIIINNTIVYVLRYCRLQELPPELYGIIAEMTAKSYRLQVYGSTDTPKDIKAITEGDRTITFDVKNELNTIFGEYKEQLKPFVNRRGLVPSEVNDEGYF